MSPLFDIEKLFAFAESNINYLVVDLENSLGAIMKWMKQSELNIYEDQTKICLFYKHDIASLIVRIGGTIINTKDSINVQGVIFNRKMFWSKDIFAAMKKSNRALNTI
jgi:hypothetical protein